VNGALPGPKSRAFGPAAPFVRFFVPDRPKGLRNACTLAVSVLVVAALGLVCGCTAPATVTGISPSSGSGFGGTSVTITGTNLSGATAVMFGSVAAGSLTVDSPTSITVTSPAEGASTVDITVVNEGGTSVVKAPADQFTFTTPTDVGTGVSPGDVTKMSTAQLTTMMQGIKGTGATWVRLDVFWSQVETSEGQWDWTLPDKTIGAALAAGLKPLAILNGAEMPSWAVSPPIAAQFTPFVSAAVARYSKEGVHTYEVWNEPNLGSNWAWQPSGASYAAILIPAYSAIKAIDPDAFVISGGLSPASDSDGNVDPETFLREMYAAGAAGHMDAVGIHSYSYPNDPMYPSSSNTFYELPAFHQIMADNGDGAKQIWSTEFGVPSNVAGESTTAQAQQLGEAFAQLEQWSWAGPLFYYDWQDGWQDPWDMCFGLLDSSGNQKPAYAVFVTNSST
jgi:hypothetical protein